MSDLSFAREWVLFLAPLPLLALAAWWWGSRRAARLARTISRTGAIQPPYVAAVLLTLAALVAIGAASQPRWGTRESKVPRTGADLVIVLDISRSMDARDVQPDRLQAAKNTINAVLDRLGGDRVGLVVFAGEAEVRFPLTTDFAAARYVVDSLQTGVLLVDGGTNAALGVEEAVTLLQDNPDAGRLILLLTDGDDLAGDPAASAALVQQSGVELLVAGVGTAEGSTIPVADAGTQSETPKLDANGMPIITRLNETFLRAVAAASGGRYLGADLSVVPGAIDGRLRALESARIEERPTVLPIERYQVFAATALALVVLAALAERFVRFPWRAGAALAALALFFGGCATAGYEANEAGRDALRDGNHELAIEKFLQAQVEEPDDPEIALNLAAAYAAAGRHDEAIRSARRAVASNRPETRSLAYSSIGHHQFALERLPDALDAFRRALLENPDNDDARHDYEVVLRLLFPEAQPTQPTPGATTEVGETPPGGPASGTPSPGPGSGSGSPVPGTATAGGGSGQGTPTPGADPGRPTSVQELEEQLEAIDQQVERLIEDGEELTTAEAYEVLRLLAERSRIAQLRNGLQGGGDPRDY